MYRKILDAEQHAKKAARKRETFHMKLGMEMGKAPRLKPVIKR